MKTAHIIVRHLYNARKVTLQGIGTIHLDASVALPEQSDRNFQFPPNALGFEADPHAGEDEDLVRTIMEQTRKIRPLASSDLESYTLLARQFLHIGKPVVIEGVGTILRTQSGEYTFAPGNYVAPRSEEAPKPLTEKIPSTGIEADRRTGGGTRSKLPLMLLLLGLLGAGGFGLYRYLSNKQANPKIPEQAVVSLTDTVRIDTAQNLTAKDSTLAPKQADSSKITPVAPADSNNFRIVIKEYTNFLTADKAYRKLISYGHKLELESNGDSTLFRIQMPFTQPLSDTSRARDSLRIFFGGKPYVLPR